MIKRICLYTITCWILCIYKYKYICNLIWYVAKLWCAYNMSVDQTMRTLDSVRFSSRIPKLNDSPGQFRQEAPKSIAPPPDRFLISRLSRMAKPYWETKLSKSYSGNQTWLAGKSNIYGWLSQPQTSDMASSILTSRWEMINSNKKSNL